MPMGSQPDLDDTAAGFDGTSVLRLLEFDMRDRSVDRVSGIGDPDARLREAVGCEHDGTEFM